VKLNAGTGVKKLSLERSPADAASVASKAVSPSFGDFSQLFLETTLTNMSKDGGEGIGKVPLQLVARHA
jgi:hypothetical protein